MKIIFLDVDGVLNASYGWERDRPDTSFYLTDECVEQLGRIVKAVPEVRFVFSSAWRNYMETARFKGMLKARGVRVQFVGKTPKDGSARGLEIQEWLDAYGKGDERFVILDDDDDMEHLLPHLVQTDHKLGLTKEKADEVIRRLS